MTNEAAYKVVSDLLNQHNGTWGTTNAEARRIVDALDEARLLVDEGEKA